MKTTINKTIIAAIAMLAMASATLAQGKVQQVEVCQEVSQQSKYKPYYASAATTAVSFGAYEAVKNSGTLVRVLAPVAANLGAVVAVEEIADATAEKQKVCHTETRMMPTKESAQ